MKDIKYPRTPHLPWSEGKTDDDKTLDNVLHFDNLSLVWTIKMDGENTTMTRDKVYARSVDSVDHPSRHWVKALWSSIAYKISPNLRICGENLFAKHSIEYENLGSYFYVFNMWIGDKCLPWDKTVDLCEDFGFKHVGVLANNLSSDAFPNVHTLFLDGYAKTQEGYVVRNRGGFNYADFSKNVAKYVRANHVQTDSHWMFQTITKNGL